jgi:digeranylgeranylglycerophospholipid reductase
MVDYDLTVIGAGPAGSIAARVAAQYGLSVLVVEQKKIVGYPSHCAGGILTNILDNMRLTSVVKKSIRARIQTIQVCSPTMQMVRHRFKKPIGWIVDRPLFDQSLLEDAHRKGAEILTQTQAIGLIKERNTFNQVIIKNKDGVQRINTKIIIGADGVANNVAKWAGLSIPRKFGIGFGYNAEHLTNIAADTVEIYFLSAIPSGYAWIFPRGADTANIGVGGYNSGTYMKAVFAWFRQKHAVAAVKLGDARLINYTGGIVPGSRIPCKTTFNYGMIVGDAANQVNLMTGEGIRLSLICGELAGTSAVTAIKGNNLSLIHQYQKLWHDKAFIELLASQILRHFFLRFGAADYDLFVDAISRVNLDLIFNKRRWAALLFQGLLRTPAALKIIRNGFRSLPFFVKLFQSS